MREDDGEPCRERSGLRVGDGEGEGFGVSCGSIAEKGQQLCEFERSLLHLQETTSERGKS